MTTIDRLIAALDYAVRSRPERYNSALDYRARVETDDLAALLAVVAAARVLSSGPFYSVGGDTADLRAALAALEDPKP